MSDLSNEAQIFTTGAKKRAENAAKIIQFNTTYDFFNSEKSSNQARFEILRVPYTNKKYHYDAVWYPFYHFTKLLIDLLRLAQAVSFIIQADVSKDDKAAQIAKKGLEMQAATVGLDFLNLILSSISLVTRTLATMIHGGYAPGIVREHARQHAKDRGWGFLSSTAGFIAEKITGIGMSFVESQISEKTFQF